jgi:hypothetical protein
MKAYIILREYFGKDDDCSGTEVLTRAFYSEEDAKAYMDKLPSKSFTEFETYDMYYTINDVEIE